MLNFGITDDKFRIQEEMINVEICILPLYRYHAASHENSNRRAMIYARDKSKIHMAGLSRQIL